MVQALQFLRVQFWAPLQRKVRLRNAVRRCRLGGSAICHLSIQRVGWEQNTAGLVLPTRLHMLISCRGPLLQHVLGVSCGCSWYSGATDAGVSGLHESHRTTTQAQMARPEAHSARQM